MTITPEDLDRYEAITNAATPGPWRRAPLPSGLQIVNDATDTENEFAGDVLAFDDVTDEDFAFICTAREAMPRLIARVRELESKLLAADEDTSVTANASGLIPCPFCGERERVYVYMQSLSKCDACGASGPDAAQDHDEIVACWNKRALALDEKDAAELEARRKVDAWLRKMSECQCDADVIWSHSYVRDKWELQTRSDGRSGVKAADYIELAEKLGL